MAPTDTMTPLERQFHQETLDGCRVLRREHGYNPSYFLQMVADHGAVGAVRRLLQTPDTQAGLTSLWEIGRLDMSCEAAILDPRYATLFTLTEKWEARKRLRAMNYPPAAAPEKVDQP